MMYHIPVGQRLPESDCIALISVLPIPLITCIAFDGAGSPPFFSRITPDFCFSHWSTQCRAAFGAPVDPHIVLGGFPTDSSFRNFSADATAFVSTFPVNSAPENRCVGGGS